MIVRNHFSLFAFITLFLVSCGTASSTEQHNDTTSSFKINTGPVPTEKVSARTCLDSLIAFVPNATEDLMLLKVDGMSIVDYTDIMLPFGGMNASTLAAGIRSMPAASTIALGNDVTPASYALVNTNDDLTACVWFYIPGGTSALAKKASSKIQQFPYVDPTIGAWGTLVVSEHVVILSTKEIANEMANTISQKKAGKCSLYQEFTLPEGIVAEICGGADILYKYEKINFTLVDQKMPDYKTLSIMTINKIYAKGTNIETEIDNTKKQMDETGGPWEFLKERGEFTPDVNRFTYVLKLRSEDQMKLLNIH